MSNQSVPTIPVQASKRDLVFFWLVDCSGSMEGSKIAALNQAIRESIPAIKGALDAHPEVRVVMRAIKFSDTASWHVGPKGVPLDQFDWPELTHGGRTATAQAINLLVQELDIEKMPRRGYPPVCILLSDGFCTDDPKDYEVAIAGLNSIPWGNRAVRLAIAIGDRSEYDPDQLRKFLNHPEVGLLEANSPTALTEYIKWASTTASVGASVGRSQSQTSDQNVVLSSAPVIENTGKVF